MYYCSSDCTLAVKKKKIFFEREKIFHDEMSKAMKYKASIRSSMKLKIMCEHEQ